MKNKSLTAVVSPIEDWMPRAYSGYSPPQVFLATSRLLLWRLFQRTQREHGAECLSTFRPGMVI